MKQQLTALLMTAPLLLGGCQDATPRPVADRTSPHPVSGPSVPLVATDPSPMPCDPGSGSPLQKVGCPDRHPETGWLTASDGVLTLTPFRTLRNDAQGREYAEDHDVEYPFSNDYFDAPNGAPHSIRLADTTVCTGIILVDYRSPLTDHVVPCEGLLEVATRRRLPAAIWSAADGVVQVSELYRP